MDASEGITRADNGYDGGYDGGTAMNGAARDAPGSGPDPNPDPGPRLTGMLPETRDGYVLPQTWAGEGVHEDIAARVSGMLEQDRDAFMDVCHACKLTDTQAAALFDSLGKALAGGIAEDNAAYNQGLAETVNRLWPRDTAQNVEIARRGARFLKIGNELDDSGLSAHPLVLRMAHAVGRMVGEDAMRSMGGEAGALPVGEAARAEMIRIIRSDAYRRNDPAAIRKVEALAARVRR